MLLASNIQIEVETLKTPTATVKHRQLPETPSLINKNTNYKQCSQGKIKRYLANPKHLC